MGNLRWSVLVLGVLAGFVAQGCAVTVDYEPNTHLLKDSSLEELHAELNLAFKKAVKPKVLEVNATTAAFTIHWSPSFGGGRSKKTITFMELGSMVIYTTMTSELKSTGGGTLLKMRFSRERHPERLADILFSLKRHAVGAEGGE